LEASTSTVSRNALAVYGFARFPEAVLVVEEAKGDWTSWV